jgi:hypothetical protein
MEEEHFESFADELTQRKAETEELEQINHELKKHIKLLETISKREAKLIQLYNSIAEARAERVRLEKLYDESAQAPVL